MTTTVPSGVSPAGYAIPAANARRNIEYGPHTDHRHNHYTNADPTRDVGGNALAIIIHGGSWKANDKTAFAESSSSTYGNWPYGYLLNSIPGCAW